MKHQHKELLPLLQNLDLGASIAEEDTLLEAARIETSAFADLLNDRVDLIPGTKGSGKSSLFRIFVDFMPGYLLSQRKVVVAHGVHAPGDPVFHAFNDEFSKLTEHEFVSFWCIYLVSLAHEQFIKDPQYIELLKNAQPEIQKFRLACEKAKIPEIKAKKSLKSILEWSLQVLKSWKPKLTYRPTGDVGEFEVDLFGKPVDSKYKADEESTDALPQYVNDIKDSLDEILKASKLSLWLMVDRLDEIFQRRSAVEKRALRGLLRAMRFFNSSSIRVKLFLRDDMLNQLVGVSEGFTALTHITARQADTLRWTEDQILSMVVKRFAANAALSEHLGINYDQVEASASYRRQCFDMIFPPTVFKGSRQSSTLRWICTHCADGLGVITPRDVLDLLIRAKQKQQDHCEADADGEVEYIIDAPAIKYGFEELSKRKRDTYLRAEFPHLWKDIEKFIGGKTQYNETTLKSLLGAGYKNISENLVAIGFLKKGQKDGKTIFSIPFLYRHAMNLTQGAALSVLK